MIITLIIPCTSKCRCVNVITVYDFRQVFGQMLKNKGLTFRLIKYLILKIVQLIDVDLRHSTDGSKPFESSSNSIRTGLQIFPIY
jgi:hypothetical protein